MRRRKRQQKIYLYLLILLGITVGFALLSTTLKIDGTANIKSNTWNIHWDESSINVTSGSVSATDPDVITTTKTDDTVTFNVNLSLPKDFYEFTIDAVNEGSIDGALDLSENWIVYKVNNVETTIPDCLKFSVTYDNGSIPQTGDVLKANQSKTYKIKVEYKDDEETLPDDDVEIIIAVTPPYIQYIEELPDVRTCAQFQSDSWETISRNVTLRPDTYPVGCEKDIDMGTYGTHTVRVANNTTPSACNSTDFSQTACGFVLEFKDVVVNHRMNPYNYSGNIGVGSKGGWEHSEMRTFVNTDIYNAIPSEIRSNIINTPTITSHNDQETDNYYTNDKLYLLSVKEVWDDNQMDSAWEYTRQTDYFSSTGTSFDGGTGLLPAIKQYQNNEDNWWLRSASYSDSDFYYVRTYGFWCSYVSNYETGVSPAFRIGKDWILTNNTNPIKNQKWEYYYNNGLKLQNGWYKLKDFSGVDQYYFFENGFMKLGWYTDTNNNTYYLSEFDEDNNNYVDGKRLTNTTKEIDGVNYTFDSNGICTNY